MLRILSGVAGVVVCLLGFVASCGAIVAAPVGLWLVRRRARRRELPLSRIASLVGSVLVSMVLAIALWSLFAIAVPKPTLQDIQSASQAQQRKPVKLPDWYTKAFPQASRYDSASQAMVKSPGYFRTAFIVGAVFIGGFFGTIGGVFGWCASILLRWAWRGRLPVDGASPV